MARLARVVVPGLPHHVTQRGNRRADIFFEDAERLAYLANVRRYAQLHGLKIWAYGLMTNHIHFVVVPVQGPHSACTFLTQTTDVVPVLGKKDAFIWLGDSIRGNMPPNARTVWLPVTVTGEGGMEILWRDAWDLSLFDSVQ